MHGCTNTRTPLPGNPVRAPKKTPLPPTLHPHTTQTMLAAAIVINLAVASVATHGLGLTSTLLPLNLAVVALPYVVLLLVKVRQPSHDCSTPEPSSALLALAPASAGA